jgi:hypothetical protein
MAVQTLQEGNRTMRIEVGRWFIDISVSEYEAIVVVFMIIAASALGMAIMK